MLPSPSKSKLGLAWCGVILAGVVAGGVSYFRARAQHLSELRANATRCALALDPDKIARLSGTRADLDSADYAETKERLIRLHAVQAEARFISVFRSDPTTGAVIYLADSEPDDSTELSFPGDAFPEAPKMPGLRSILADGQPTTEGPIADSFGVFVTGYAQIGPARSTSRGWVRELVAIDISVERWSKELLGAAFRTAGYTWLLLGVALGVGSFRRSHLRREALLQKLSAAVEQSHSGLMVVSPDGRIEFVNESLCEHLGRTAGQLMGRPCSEFAAAVSPSERVGEMLARVTEGQVWEGHWMNRRDGAEAFPSSGVVSPVRDARGNLLGYLALIHDLTAQHRHQEELRQAKERAEAGDQAKGLFLATMSHEVRTPLNGIVGFTNLLLETPLTSEQREYVQTIRTSGEALVQLTGDILDFSRIESGTLQLDAAVCDLRAAVEDALDLFAARAAEKNVQLLHWIEPDVPGQVVLDVGRLRQVLVNLVGNGIKFTPAGAVEVSVRVLTGKAASLAPFDIGVSAGQLVAELDDGSLTFEFAVRDTGIGIAASDRSRLFQPFTQLDGSTVRRFGGAGLGLAISRNLVRLMGGDIWIESEPGKGSTFFFTVRGRPPAASERHETPPPVSLVGSRVALVVEDPSLRDELGRVLAQAGARVAPVPLHELARESWDLAVVDCTEGVLAEFDVYARQPGWRPSRTFGLVTVKVTSLERQFLRPHLRMIVNKPAHHRALVTLLGRAWVGRPGAEAPAGERSAAG